MAISRKYSILQFQKLRLHGWHEHRGVIVVSSVNLFLILSMKIRRPWLKKLFYIPLRRSTKGLQTCFFRLLGVEICSALSYLLQKFLGGNFITMTPRCPAQRGFSKKWEYLRDIKYVFKTGFTLCSGQNSIDIKN